MLIKVQICLAVTEGAHASVWKNARIPPMSKPYSRFFAFALFAIVMVNTLAWSMDSHRIAHDLEHSREFTQMALLPEQADEHQHEQIALDDDEPGVSEHQLFHAVDHLPLFLSSVACGSLLALRDLVTPQMSSGALPQAAFNPPFRPPRRIPSLV